MFERVWVGAAKRTLKLDVMQVGKTGFTVSTQKLLPKLGRHACDVSFYLHHKRKIVEQTQ